VCIGVYVSVCLSVFVIVLRL